MIAHRKKAEDSEVDNIVDLGAVQNKPARSKKDKIDEALDAGIAKIRRTWWRIENKELRGAYGRQQLLQDIYAIYCQWDNQDIVPEIHGRLNQRLEVEEGVDFDVLSLLIQISLPHIQLASVDMWTSAIRYGQHNHVRPWKLRGFLWVKGGLERCARLYRE